MINTIIIYNKIKRILEQNNMLVAYVICMNVDYWSHSYCDVVVVRRYYHCCRLKKLVSKAGRGTE